MDLGTIRKDSAFFICNRHARFIKYYLLLGYLLGMGSTSKIVSKAEEKWTIFLENLSESLIYQGFLSL